jgi:hypothetical protein
MLTSNLRLSLPGPLLCEKFSPRRTHTKELSRLKSPLISFLTSRDFSKHSALFDSSTSPRIHPKCTSVARRIFSLVTSPSRSHSEDLGNRIIAWFCKPLPLSGYSPRVYFDIKSRSSHSFVSCRLSAENILRLKFPIGHVGC